MATISGAVMLIAAALAIGMKAMAKKKQRLERNSVADRASCSPGRRVRRRPEPVPRQEGRQHEHHVAEGARPGHLQGGVVGPEQLGGAVHHREQQPGEADEQRCRAARSAPGRASVGCGRQVASGRR